MHKAIPSVLCVCLALAAATPGCVTDRAVRQKETLLVEAGFRPIAAVSSDQRWLIRTIPADQVSAIARRGKVYFVYPDQTRGILYVGHDAEFLTYMQKAQAQSFESKAWDTAWGDWDAR